MLVGVRHHRFALFLRDGNRNNLVLEAPFGDRGRSPSLALSPEPKSRLTLTAVVFSGRPAFRVASRALNASSPTWPTHPRMTSSTASGDTPLRSTAALTACAPSSEVGTSLKAPANLPMAVRTAPATT